MRKPPADITLLLQELESPDWKVRRYAAQSLGASRNTQAVEALVRLLGNDKSWTVRCRAAVALGRLKDERAIEPLIRALGSGNWQLFRHAYSALLKFGEKAIPVVNQSISDEFTPLSVRNALVNLSGAIGSAGSFFVLCQQLYDDQLIVRMQAIHALARLPHEGVFEKLLQVLEHPEPLPPAPHAPGTAPELVALWDPAPAIRQSVVEALMVLNDRRAAIPVLKLFIGEEPYGRCSDLLMAATKLIRLLAGVRTREFYQLAALLENHDFLVRAAAIISLSWMRDQRAVPLLLAATRDADPQVREIAWWAHGALQAVLSYDVPAHPLVIAHILS